MSPNRFLFIIPLKSRKNSLNWDLTCKLLDRTLMSIEGQLASDYHTLVVCDEFPSVEANLSRTTVISEEFSVGENYTELGGQIDKQRKLYRGLIEARQVAPEWIMFVDADDLLHRKLVDYVFDHPNYGGYLLTRGYRHEIGRRYLVKSRAFHQMSGSSIIFPFKSIRFPEHPTPEDFASNYMTAQHHNQTIEKDFRNHDIRYRSIPFYAAIYIRGHGDSLRDVGYREASQPKFPTRKVRRRLIGLLRKAQGQLLGHQAINARILNEFSGFSGPLADGPGK